MNTLSIIVSVYNEEASLQLFWDKTYVVLQELKNYQSNVIFVNDGSKDNSMNIIKTIIAENNTHIKIKGIEFSRNFGHEAAMIAGIDSTDSDVIICMDADLQHPPDKIPEMLQKFETGTDIIMMTRTKRKDKNFISNLLSSSFYKIINWLADNNFENNASDFFMITNKVATVLKENFRERNRFLRGYIQIIGFNITTLNFEAPARIAGESHYNFFKLLKLSTNAIFSFSNKPLNLSLFFTFLFFLLSLVLTIFSLYSYFWGDTPPSGYTTLITFQSLGFSVLCLLISVFSIYFGKVISEIRYRPIYIIKETVKSE